MTILYTNKEGKVVESRRDYPNRRKDHFADSNYRRGYHQGYSQAIDDYRAKWIDIISFFNNILTKWRYGKKPFKSLSEMEIPPIK